MKKINEEQVASTLDDWARAIRDGDMEQVVALHTKDILMFDVIPPFQIKGMKAFRKTWEVFFEHSNGGKGSFNLSNIKITATNKVAFASAALKVGKIKVRLTVGLVKEKSKWLISHEHHSVLET